MDVIDLSRLDISSLSGKNVLITGGCSGIGLSTVEYLHSAGCDVVVGDFLPPPADHLAFKSSRIRYCHTDITSWESLRKCFDLASQSHPIDVVLANAGINEYGDQFFTPRYDGEGHLLEPDYRVLDVNLRGTSNTVALAVHHMERGGCIVITGSLAGYMSAPGMPVYGASKHGKTPIYRSIQFSIFVAYWYETLTRKKVYGV